MTKIMKEEGELISGSRRASGSVQSECMKE
jgi:hypothetical protein